MGEKNEPLFYGGQAVLEGVMMRGRETWAVAVRRPSQEIYVECRPVRSLSQRYRLFRRPVFRGVAALGEAMAIGVRALSVSANESLGEDERLTPGQMAFSMILAFGLFIVLFIVLPAVGVSFAGRNIGRSLTYNLVEGLIRIGIFLGYLLLIAQMREIRRVFMYHGAEHKTIAAYEAGEPELNPTAVDRYSTLHVRCGTNFLIIVMILTILVFSVFGRPALWLRILERIAAIPLIAGLSYEAIRLGANRGHNPLVRALMKPGLWLQKITTRQPTRDQIEVAIRAFEAVLPVAERAKVAPLPSPVVPAPEESGAPGLPAGQDSPGDPGNSSAPDP